MIQEPQRRVMPQFPVYISVLFASFNPHSDATRLVESMLFVDNHVWVSISVLLVTTPVILSKFAQLSQPWFLTCKIRILS